MRNIVISVKISKKNSYKMVSHKKREEANNGGKLNKGDQITLKNLIEMIQMGNLIIKILGKPNKLK